MNFKAMPTTATPDMISAAYALLETMPLNTPDRQKKAVFKIWQAMAAASPPPPQTGLLLRQRQAFEVISDFILEHGRSPTYDEIAAQMNMHKSQVHYIVKALKRRGYIHYREGGRRSIRIIEPPATKP